MYSLAGLSIGKVVPAKWSRIRNVTFRDSKALSPEAHI